VQKIRSITVEGATAERTSTEKQLWRHPTSSMDSIEVAPPRSNRPDLLFTTVPSYAASARRTFVLRLRSAPVTSPPSFPVG